MVEQVALVERGALVGDQRRRLVVEGQGRAAGSDLAQQRVEALGIELVRAHRDRAAGELERADVVIEVDEQLVLPDVVDGQALAEAARQRELLS